MNIVIPTIIIAVLYGVYDVLIKLSALKVTPTLGALITQLFSVALIMGFMVYQFLINRTLPVKITASGFMLTALAGITIGFALIFLFILLQNKELKATSILPVILVIRNVTVILLGIFMLKEDITLLKALGFALSLVGVYLIF